MSLHVHQVRADLPVGDNLQSHVGTGEVAFTLQQPVSFNPLRLLLNPLNILAYLLGGGPLGRRSSGLLEIFTTPKSVLFENIYWL